MFSDFLDETGAAIAEMAERLCADNCTVGVNEAADRGEFPTELWGRLEDAGLTHACHPESAGGIELELAGALPIVAIAARHSAPVPLCEMLIAASCARLAGVVPPAGILTIAVGGDVTLAPSDGSWRLEGHVCGVPWGSHAAAIALVASASDGPKLCVVDTGSLETRTSLNMAREPRDDMSFDVSLSDAQVGDFPGGVDRLRRYAALARAVQMAGALERVRDLSVQYATERKQFGRALSRFQAIQHSIAVLATDAAAAEAAAGAGLADPEATLGVAVAKARSGEAAGRAAALAHQVHGAMGFTYEHQLHHLTRRLWAWRDEYGNEMYWQKKLGAALVARGPEALWPTITEIGHPAV